MSEAFTALRQANLLGRRGRFFLLVLVLDLFYFEDEDENENDDTQGRVLRSAKRAALLLITY